MPRFVDLSGQVFGRLTVLTVAGKHSAGNFEWNCRCKRGELFVARSYLLRNGATKSCGCLRREAKMIHGLYYSPEYRVWAAMLQRCSNPKDSAYRNYGGRGIKACKRWHKFANFIADMGMRPGKKMTLERINNNKGYCPSNCKWATWKEQAGNKRPRIKAHDL